MNRPCSVADLGQLCVLSVATPFGDAAGLRARAKDSHFSWLNAAKPLTSPVVESRACTRLQSIVNKVSCLVSGGAELYRSSTHVSRLSPNDFCSSSCFCISSPVTPNTEMLRCNPAPPNEVDFGVLIGIDEPGRDAGDAGWWKGNSCAAILSPCAAERGLVLALWLVRGVDG